MIKRFKRLVSEMWWLLLLVLGASVGMAYFLSPFFLVTLPMVAGFFTYFSLVRYDSEGRDREM